LAFSYAYIMASQRRVLYIGVTANLEVRVWQHKFEPEGFVAKYQTNKLVSFEQYVNILSAIGREKVLKGWRRERKVALIESVNPKWRDLSTGWYVRQVARRGTKDPLSSTRSSGGRKVLRPPAAGSGWRLSRAH